MQKGLHGRKKIKLIVYFLFTNIVIIKGLGTPAVKVQRKIPCGMLYPSEGALCPT